MKYQIYPRAILLLEDGTVWHGYAIGKIGTTTGEICFNTGMTGYQEIYTDPSYFGQIIVNTTSHIGNYGVYQEEQESERAQLSGLVCNAFSTISSRARASGTLDEYFKKLGIVGISGVDTRSLVRHIRDKGAMNAIISSDIFEVSVLQKQLAQVPSMLGLELSSQVSTRVPYFAGKEDADIKVAVLDLGIKTNILRSLVSRNCYCKVFPARTPFEEMEQWGADGYFMSNGPGDPASMAYAVETAGKILDSGKPFFGICLGHQILAEACGISTYKMHHGHRGLNHPVKNLISGKCEITSQNHGFSVSEDNIYNRDDVTITHINLNDNTIAGLKVNHKKAFSVQYHPEASPGPHDASYLFDDFVKMLSNN